MRLPTIKKILREDLKDAPAWVQGIIDPFNSVAETLYQALNKNVTLGDNVACFIKEFVYTTPSTYPSGVEEFRFSSTLKTKAAGVMLMQAVDRSNYSPAIGPVYVPWVEVNGMIVLSTIQGLSASKSYDIRLLVT